MRPGSRPPFLALCREEPFRLFFPLGVLIGISGVSLWPLYFTGLHKFYPGIMHARMMIEGFLTAFVIGFLGTAGPRLTGTPILSRSAFGTGLLLLLRAVGVHIGQQYVVGDALFLALLLGMLGWVISRFRHRTELPPPGLALIPLGLLHGILGTALLIAGTSSTVSPYCVVLGGMLLHQGFLLCLVLGVGSFLLPKFLRRSDLPETEEPDAIAWKSKALQAAGVGLLILLSYTGEVLAPWPQLSELLRVVVIAIYLVRQIPLARQAAPPTLLTRSLRLASGILVIGLLFPLLFPWQRVAGLHLLFIGGFTLLIFAVATRVILGHAGREDLVANPPSILRGVVVLLLIAALLRVIGDFLPADRGSLLSGASYLWMIGAVVWSWRILPSVRITAADDAQP